jgi:hypothetical protein
MSMLHHAENPRTADLRRAAVSFAGRLNGAGVYLTDEVFLYRVVSVDEGRGEVIVELEDCYGLDVVHVPVQDLHARPLRVVTPAVSG